MSKNADRGTKRTCQNGSCGARFYDLARDPIACPMCGSAYVPVVPAISAAAAREEAAAQRRAAQRKPEVVPVAGDPPEVEAEDALADVEGAEEPAAAGEDETFLEAEEDEGGVADIIPGSPAEGEEEP